MECPCGYENEASAQFCVGCGQPIGDEPDNFWDEGGYKPVLKRINNGPKLCDELCKLATERAALEKAYSKSLSAWAERWEEKVVKINEYGTVRDGWRATLTEARALADAHLQIREKLESEFKPSVENWKKSAFPKSLIHYKSYKRANAAFSKAQGPWIKRKEKVAKHKRAMEEHLAAAEKLKAQARDGLGDKEKLQASANKEEREAARSREKLKQRIREMHEYADVYQREMILEFDRCQQEEKHRIDFFKESFQQYHQLVEHHSKTEKAHQQLHTMLSTIGADCDLAQFAKEFGTDMPVHLPDEAGNFRTRTGTLAPSSRRPAAAASAGAVESFPDKPAVSDDGLAPGTKMTAMYDYSSDKPDELQFSAGAIITVLPSTPEVEAGWMKGHLNGSVGIFPGNYVEPADEA
eukprot:m.85408 g.85408  ORF g.85408 m.85408 type:complete len:409 (-) comp14844_c2_seq2:419-1645(-)